MSLNYEILYELYKIEPIKVRQMHERDLAIKEASLIKDNLKLTGLHHFCRTSKATADR